MMSEPGSPRSFLKGKTLWLVGAQLMLVALLSEAVLHLWSQRQAQQQWMQVLAEANQTRAILESELNAAAALATGVGIYVSAREGNLNDADLDRMLEAVFERGSYFRNIGLAPGNRIEYIYPLEGNEAALGLDYEALPEQWPVVQEIIATGSGRLAGPLELAQGGEALLYREPISVNGEHWGILSSVINSSLIARTLGPLMDASGAATALRGKDALGAAGDTILGDPSVFDSPGAVYLDIYVPGGTWQLAARPLASAIALPQGVRPAVWGLMLVLVFAVIGSVRAVLQRTTLARLEALVQERTHSLAEANGLLSSVLDAAKDVSIIATDQNGLITLFNKGAEQMLGYSADEMVEQKTPEVLHKAEEVWARAKEVEQKTGHRLSPFEAITRRAAQGDQDISEWTYIRKDGSTLPVDLVICPIYGPDTRLTGFLGIATDITERKRVDRIKNEFVATVSHELRTPLTSIIGSLTLLQHQVKDSLPEQGSTLLQMAIRNADRLAALINDLLDISKIEAGMLELNMSAFSLEPLIHESIALQKGYADKFDVTMRLANTVSDLQVYVDASRLQQVLSNLLSNAIKFSPAGGEVVVRMERVEGRARISIQDEGQGIPEAFQPRLFDKFTQADSSDSRSLGGTGLGLAICRELMVQMQGHIDFTTEVGQGSVFWIELPLSDQLTTTEMVRAQ